MIHPQRFEVIIKHANGGRAYPEYGRYESDNVVSCYIPVQDGEEFEIVTRLLPRFKCGDTDAGIYIEAYDGGVKRPGFWHHKSTKGIRINTRTSFIDGQWMRGKLAFAEHTINDTSSLQEEIISATSEPGRLIIAIQRGHKIDLPTDLHVPWDPAVHAPSERQQEVPKDLVEVRGITHCTRTTDLKAVSQPHITWTFRPLTTGRCFVNNLIVFVFNYRSQTVLDRMGVTAPYTMDEMGDLLAPPQPIISDIDTPKFLSDVQPFPVPSEAPTSAQKSRGRRPGRPKKNGPLLDTHPEEPSSPLSSVDEDILETPLITTEPFKKDARSNVVDLLSAAGKAKRKRDKENSDDEEEEMRAELQMIKLEQRKLQLEQQLRKKDKIKREQTETPSHGWRV